MARSRKKNARRVRRQGAGMSTFTAGLIAIVVIGVGSFLGFTKHIPFTHGYRVKAVFTSANSIRKNSPVRIAGVNVGKVKSVARYENSNDSVVTLELQKSGLPIHTDATMQIRPRIFLEGNFFVDLRPGTPEAPTLKDNGTIPVAQTSTPVQLDQVLTALQGNTRSDLQTLLDQYGAALAQKPTAAEDKGQDADVVGLTGAQALQRTLKYSPAAFKNSAIVNQATLGTEPHDLSGVIASLGKVATALNSREVELKDLITHFNQTVAATASEADNLRAGLHLLPTTLTNAYQALGSVDAALPATRAFARDILPGVHESAATINASFPWIDQTEKLLGPSELQGVAKELRRTSPSLGTLIDGTTRLLPQVDLLDRCVSDVILPTGNVKITADGINSGRENYKEFWYAMVGLASEGQNFDGNGSYVRFQPGGGLKTIETAGKLSGERLFGNYDQTPLGTAPAYPHKASGAALLPPLKPHYPCYKNGALTSAELNGPAAHGTDAPVVSSRPSGTPAIPGLPALPLAPLSALPGVVSTVTGIVTGAARQHAAKPAAKPAGSAKVTRSAGGVG